MPNNHPVQWQGSTSPCCLACDCCDVLQAQLSNALASLDSATASVAEQQELINNLQVEGTGGCSCKQVCITTYNNLSCKLACKHFCSN
jgi:hypothetical protein